MAAGEEEDASVFAVRSSVFVMISLIIAMSVAFEKCKEGLEDTTSPNMRPILSSLFGELTLLGFIGLLVFMVGRFDVLPEWSMSILGEADMLGELFEQVHMALFLVMVIFLLQVIGLVSYGTATERAWRSYEGAPVVTQAVHFNTLRTRFLAGQVQVQGMPDNRLPVDFDFADYLSICMGETLSEIVEVPVSAWVCLEVVIVIIWGIQFQFETPFFFPVAALLLGLLSVALLLALRRKTMTILNLLMPGATIKLAWDLAKHRADEGHTMQQLGERTRLLSAEATSSYTSGLAGLPPYLTRPGYHPACLPLYRLVGWMCGGQHHAGHGGHRGQGQAGGQKQHHDVSKQDALFWFGPHGLHFLLFSFRCLLLVNAIYIAALALIVHPILYAHVHTAVFVVLVLLSAVPVVLVVVIIPGVITRTIIVAHIEMRKDQGKIAVVLRHMKTTKTLQVLRILGLMQTVVCEKEEEEEEQDGAAGKQRRTAKDVYTDRLTYNRKRTETMSVFESFDQDHSGRINADEIGALFVALGLPAGQVDSILTDLDDDDSGDVSFEELFDWLARKEALQARLGPEEVAKGIFKLVDQDGSGSITVEELQATINGVGQTKMSIQELQFVVAEVDENGDGEIDEEEFIGLLNKYSTI